MGFATVLGLLGLVAIAIPIVIHLTKVKQAPVVWVGDIRLLKGQDAKLLKPTNIDNWPLLVLRVLIVVVATLALAKPYFYDLKDDSPLALVTPDWLRSANDQQIAQLSENYVVKYLFEDQLPVNDLWARLSYFDEIQPQSQAFHIFASDSLNPWYVNSRPLFSRKLHWHLQKTNTDITALPKALIISANQQMPALGTLTQAFELLGYQVSFAANEAAYLGNTNHDTKVIVDVDDSLANYSHHDSAIIKGGDWLLGYQQVDFIFTLRQLIEGAHSQKLPASLAPHFAHGTLNAEQLSVKVDQNLYPQTTKQSFFEQWLLMLLLILVVAERLLSEYGPYAKQSGKEESEDGT